jgi:hypothetical protein
VSARRPLALTDNQMRAVLDGARIIVPWWRAAFLRAIADRLEGPAEITDAQVQHAIADCLSRFGHDEPEVA